VFHPVILANVRPESLRKLDTCFLLFQYSVTGIGGIEERNLKKQTQQPDHGSDSASLEEPEAYASPPCQRHEIDPTYLEAEPAGPNEPAVIVKSLEDLVFFADHAPEFEEFLTVKEKCIRGQPLQRTWHHFTSADGRFFAGIWEAEPGCWAVSYTEKEICQVLAGRSILRDSNGRERVLEPGDNFTIPAGFRGQWEVLETTRKIYVIYDP